MEEKKYDLETIKKAFWEAFHKSGELWFYEIDFDEELQFAEEELWKEFEKSLMK